MPATGKRRAGRPLALILSAAIVPLIIFSAAVAFVSLRQTRVGLERDALTQTQRISALVDAQLTAQLGVLNSLAHAPALDDPPDLSRFAENLRREQAAQPLWIAGILSDPEGHVVIHTLLPLPRRVVDPESLRRSVETRAPVVGAILPGQVGPGLALRVPVIRNGEVHFVLTAAIKPDGIRDLLLTAGLPKDWTGTVVDGAGHVVARTQGDPTLLGAPASTAALAARARGGSGLYAGRLLEGVSTISAFHVSPATGWSVHIGIPRSVFDAPFQRALWIAIAGGLAALLLTGGFLALLAREIRQRRNETEVLEHAQRMEGLGRLTGGVAHDFNNLLGVILGNVELLERRLPELRGNASLEAIRRAGQRGVDITRSLLVFGRSGTAGASRVSVNVCLRDMLGMLRQTVGADVTVELDLDERLPAVELDRVQFDLALLNLASNARDAMPKGGTLRIGSRAFPMPDGQPGVAITVADTGVGIARDIQRRVFEPFFTTKSVGRGTGLGLAQVYGFARGAGGDAKVDSQPGHGTRITLLLPAANGEAAPDANSTPAQTDPSPGSRRVLLVDDNAEVRGMAASYLRECGYAVDEADDAADALATLSRNALDIDVVVSDVVMPGRIDGLGLVQEILRRWPKLPVLLVSGYSGNLDEARARGVPVLTKPFALTELTEQVRKLCQTQRDGRASPTNAVSQG